MADLSSQPTVIQSLYGMYRTSKLIVNRKYQRKLVWTLEEKQKLIESIQRGYPIPAILLAEKINGEGKFEIIDGLQRLHAIFFYIENGFPNLDGNYFDIEQFTTAKALSAEDIFTVDSTSKKISAKECSSILDYTVALSIMRNASEEQINDVFGRINTYGHRLSDQERRQAGVMSQFADLVRTLACSVRGDVSQDTLMLYEMPNISVDLPKMQHGYDVKAEEVFWVKHGILRSTDLRDSVDEQVIADTVACMIGSELITRSKVALDALYDINADPYNKIATELEVYGVEKVSSEFKFVIGEIEKIANSSSPEFMKSILFKSPNSNAFPSIFSFVFIAIFQIIIKDKKKISNYYELKNCLRGCADRLTQGQKATNPAERGTNIDIVKGLISKNFVDDEEPRNTIYKDLNCTEIENAIRRSGLEISRFELKQGIIKLDGSNTIDESVATKVLATICGMANIEPNSFGQIIIGVCDKQADSERILQLHKVSGKKVSNRFVVGVKREADILSWTEERYFQYWRDKIKDSEISEPLKSAVLNSLDYHSYFGLGLLIINVPKMNQVSYLGERMFDRQADQTIEVTLPKKIAELSARF